MFTSLYYVSGANTLQSSVRAIAFISSASPSVRLSLSVCVHEKCGSEPTLRPNSYRKLDQSEWKSEERKKNNQQNKFTRHQNTLTITFTIINNTQSNYKLIACGVFTHCRYIKARASEKENKIKPGIGNEYITAHCRLTCSVGVRAPCERKLPDESFRYCSCSRFHQQMHTLWTNERAQFVLSFVIYRVREKKSRNK